MENKLFDIITNTPYGTKTYGDVLEPIYIANVLVKHLVENRVKVLRCEAGDILWYLDYGLPKCFICPEKIVVQDIVILKNTMLIRCSKSIALRPEDFGRIAFYTREEAENVLNRKGI